MRLKRGWKLALAGAGMVLAGCGAQAAPSYHPPSFPPGNPMAGARLYATTCSTCHGPTAQGVPGVAPALRGRRAFGTLYTSEAQLAQFIEDYMPKNNPGSLSRQQAADAAAFIWGLNGHLGAATQSQLLAALGQAPPAPAPSSAPSAAPPSAAPSPAPAPSQPAVTAAEIAAGQRLYAQVCSVCHGAQGQGGVGPSLWGPSSAITAGSPFANLSSLANFIKTSMPAAPTNGYAPGSLSPAQAHDAAAYILQQNHLLK
ncbi:MAG: c-type cytochrome [Firmicutes bacterium]|nr:c-type cytochrome [Alicyclobacillaceae bacterium]MCL6497478.1 c-type cytochrome [Bacillota bacterium]